MPRALISVSFKRDIEDFAADLVSMGWEIISTGGTQAALKSAGIEVIPIEAVTGMPEMMGGRLKTLHPAILGGILADRDNRGHMADLQRHGFVPIDLVVVNLYPFEETFREPEYPLDRAVENIDIGGSTMIRAAAKNWRHVGVVVSPVNYGLIQHELAYLDHLRFTTRYILAMRALTHAARCDSDIAGWLATRGHQLMLDELTTGMRIR